MAGKDKDTTLGGPSKEFPLTTAGFLEEVRRFGPENPKGVEELCRRYWKPVYLFIRVAWAKTNEDAKDLTQAFFAWVMQGDVLSRYRSGQAAFRTFLKALVRRFVADERKAAGRQKRGGGAGFVSFDEEAPRLEDVVADARAADPEKVFDQAWLVSVMKYAVAAVRDRLLKEGREAHFRIFEETDLRGGPDGPSSAELGRKFGLTDRQVRNILITVRRQLREEIRSELARQTGSPEEFQEEWNALLGT